MIVLRKIERWRVGGCFSRRVGDFCQRFVHLRHSEDMCWSIARKWTREILQVMDKMMSHCPLCVFEAGFCGREFRVLVPPKPNLCRRDASKPRLMIRKAFLKRLSCVWGQLLIDGVFWTALIWLVDHPGLPDWPPCVKHLAASQRRLSQVEAAKTALLEAQREHLDHWALPEETREIQLAALQEAEGLRLPKGAGRVPIGQWGFWCLKIEHLSCLGYFFFEAQNGKPPTLTIPLGVT